MVDVPRPGISEATAAISRLPECALIITVQSSLAHRPAQSVWREQAIARDELAGRARRICGISLSPEPAWDLSRI